MADDFRVLRTTARSAARFWKLFPLPGVADLTPVLIVGTMPALGSVRSRVTIFDAEAKSVLEAEVDTAGGHVRRAGVECPVGGLHVSHSSHLS